MKNITSTFITKTRLLAALTITCCALAFAGAQAGDAQRPDNDNNSGRERSILMSFNESFTSQTTLDGDITLTGGISVRGTRHEDFSVLHVNHDGSEVVVGGTSTITASGGTITTRFVGTIYFDNATFPVTQLAYIEGTESVTGGTGVYAGVMGEPGTFEATIDYTTGAGIGVFEAKVRLPR
jgi:hypothetical protein